MTATMKRPLWLGSLAMLAHGWDDMFQKTAKDFAERASRDPVRYSPASYAMSAITPYVR